MSQRKSFNKPPVIFIVLLALLLAAAGIWAILSHRAALAQGAELLVPTQAVIVVDAASSATATPLPSATPTSIPTSLPTSTPTSLPTFTATPTAQATSTATPTVLPSPAASPAPVVSLKITSYNAKLLTGPGRAYDLLRELNFAEQVTLLGRVDGNNWLYVKTSDGQEGWVQTDLLDYSGVYFSRHPLLTPQPTPVHTPETPPGATGRWIDIDITEQRLYAFEDSNVVASFLVSTGIARFPTVTGQFHIYDKLPFKDMMGDGYYLPDVPWTMHYDESYSIHGTYWHHNFGTPMSHGCINMDTKDAEWLYNWASVGTLVNIHW